MQRREAVQWGDSHGGGGWRRRHAGPPHMCVAASLPGAGPARWAGLQVTNRVEWQVWPGSYFHTPNHNPRNRDLPCPTSAIPQEHSEGLTPTILALWAPAALSGLSLSSFPSCASSAPAEKMLMAMSKANSASFSCSSFMALENSKMGLMNST